MAHLRHRLLVALLMALVTTLLPTQPTRAVGSRTEITGATPEQSSLLKWARSDFVRAGLPLPDLDVRFYPDREACGDAHGRYRRDGGLLRMCNRGELKTSPRHTLLHELTHAWSFEYLDRDTIRAFLELRDLDEWADPDDDWWDMGQEQAAEIVAWGLMGEYEFNSFRTQDEPCDALAAAYTLLTGNQPTRPGVYCT